MIDRQRKLTTITAVLCLMIAFGGALVSAQTPELRQLTTGQPIERELKGDEAHSYSLTLTAGQYLNIVVEQKGVDVVVILFDAGGKKVIEVDSPNGTQGTEPLALIIETAGNYRLEVRSLDKTAAAGRYEVKIKELRAATEKDKNKIAAEKAFAEGEAMRSQRTAESLRGAIKKYEEALLLYRAAGDRGGEAVSFNNIGYVYSALGEKQKALEFYNQALPLYRVLGNRRGESTTLTNIGYIYSDLGENQKALEYYNQDLQISRAIGDKGGEATTLNNIGYVYSILGEKQKALEFYNQALSLYRAVADKDGEATTLTNIGGVYSALGENQKALEYYNQDLQIARASGDKGGEARTLNNIGLVYSVLGENRKALEYFTQALPLRRVVGDRSGEVRTLNNIGGIYSILGENQKALEYLIQVLPLVRAVGNRGNEAIMLNNIGTVYQNLGEKQKALEYHNQALPIYRAVGDRDGEATTFNNIGAVYADLGEKQKALEYFTQVLPLYRAVGNRTGEATTLDSLSHIWQTSGNPRFGVLYGKLSVNNYQLLRSNVQGLDKNIQQTYLKSIENAYRRLADALLAQGRFSEAQQILNLFKDQQYFDFNSNKQTALLAMTARETALATDFNKKLETIVGALRRLDDFKRSLGNRSTTVTETDEIKTLEQSLKTANDDYQAFLRTAAQQFAAPFDNTDKMPTILDLEQMQAILREVSASTKQKTVAIYTLVGKENYRSLVITSDDIFAVSSPIKGEVLNQKAQQLWRLLRTPDYDPQPLAKEIYDVVFAPLAAKLPADTKTILWSLDGNLRYVPVSALHDGKQYLVERYNNVVFTRADRERLVRAVSTNPKGTGFGSSESHTVKLAGESFNASALPSVKTELSRIFKNGNSSTGILPGGVLLNERFSKATMLSELQKQHPVVHIASHFKFEAGDEARSFLLLGDGTTFTLDEMKREQNLFGGVDLLTLSACQTAAQRADASGREVDGFAELAQRLGAGAVMASLWEVSDDSTAELMTRFYRTYKSRAGTNKAEALRTSQLALLRGLYKTASTKKRELTREDASAAEKIKIDSAKLKPFKANKNAPFTHPFYWSPFILVGNWK